MPVHLLDNDSDGDGLDLSSAAQASKIHGLLEEGT